MRTPLRPVIAVLAIGAAALLAFCAILYLSFGQVTEADTQLVVSEALDARFEVETPVQVRRHLEIRGWVLLEGEFFGIWDNQVILRNNETGESLKLPTMMEMRPDVTEEQDDGFRLPGLTPSDQFGFYDPSGFVARVPIGMLTSPREAYSVLIHIRSDNRDLLIDTNRSLG